MTILTVPLDSVASNSILRCQESRSAGARCSSRRCCPYNWIEEVCMRVHVLVLTEKAGSSEPESHSTS